LGMMVEAPGAKPPWCIVVEDDEVAYHALRLAQALRNGVGQREELAQDRPAILVFDQGSRKRRYDRAVSTGSKIIIVMDRSTSDGLCDIRVRASEPPGRFLWHGAAAVFDLKLVGDQNDAREATVLGWVS